MARHRTKDEGDLGIAKIHADLVGKGFTVQWDPYRARRTSGHGGLVPRAVTPTSRQLVKATRGYWGRTSVEASMRRPREETDEP